jgi:Ankyrin repeats (3 copies)
MSAAAADATANDEYQRLSRTLMSRSLRSACGFRRNRLDEKAEDVRRILREAARADFPGEKWGAIIRPTPTTLSLVSSRDSSGWTCVHFAALVNNLECLKLVLAAGAPVSAGDNSDQTPLHVTAEYGRVECCRVLTAAGADVLARDAHGRTPLMVALEHKQIRTGYGRSSVIDPLVLEVTDPLVAVRAFEIPNAAGLLPLEMLMDTSVRKHVEQSLSTAELRLGALCASVLMWCWGTRRSIDSGALDVGCLPEALAREIGEMVLHARVVRRHL